jgi:hypothetical protein
MLKTLGRSSKGKSPLLLVFLKNLQKFISIHRYLQDWKERACLKVDELDTLFSNIQEIYEFNSSLLEKLIESKIDPHKISKCFIEAHERFDVYTTYW